MAASKQALLDRGLIRIGQWCDLNNVERPTVVVHRDDHCKFGTCAYYRNNEIQIWVKDCAPVGMAGRAWSYPGYVVDRTPFGVLAHELGHHVENAEGPRGGRVARAWRQLTGDKPITGYASNDNEWFAEMFRLYVTNPDLLLHIRPKIHALLSNAWRPIETRTWRQVLAGADRQISAARNKIEKVFPNRSDIWPPSVMKQTPTPRLSTSAGADAAGQSVRTSRSAGAVVRRHWSPSHFSS